MLKDIGLSKFGVWYYPTKRVLICVNTGCRCATRSGHVLGHIKSHKSLGSVLRGLNADVITRALEGVDLIGDTEAVLLSHEIVAPLPFLQLFPSQSERKMGLRGLHCSQCSFASTSKGTMTRHCSTHSAASGIRPKNNYTEGYVQRYFKNQHGSSYFKVDPVLTGVDQGSDFDIFFTSAFQERRQEFLSEAAAGGIASDTWDESPFLAKTSWLNQVRGYSLDSMRRRVRSIEKSDSQHLNKVPKLAIAYIRSLKQGDVHPAHLSRLNNWKS